MKIGPSVDPQTVQPSAGKAFATWLFGGATPMDMARANALELEQKRQAAQLRQAFLTKLMGGGEAAPAIPTRPEPITNDAGQDISDAFAPRAPQPAARIPTRSGPPSLRESADWLLPAAVMGVPGAKEAVDFIKEAQPKLTNVHGFMVDERDPGNVGRFFGEPPAKGAEPILNQRGEHIGWQLMDGTFETISKAREAEERGKTRGSILEVPTADGRAVMMPGAEFLDGRSAPGGAGSGVVPRVPGLGVKPSKAEETLQTKRAETKAEVEALTPKASSTLQSLDRKSDFILETLDKAIGQIGDWSAGPGEMLKVLPGSPARNLDSTLDTLRANLGFAELQSMRDNSPTGGAVGSLTERELGLLSSMIGSLDQGQSPAQLKANLSRMRDELKKVRDERRAAFQRQYGSAASGASSVPPPAQRKAGEVYQTPKGPMKWTGTGWLPQ